MADPIRRLQKLDTRRVILHTYSRRIRMARFLAPDAERRMQLRLDRRFQDITRERRQLLEIIRSDPVLRTRLQDYEKELTANARTTTLQAQSSKVPKGDRDR